MDPSTLEMLVMLRFNKDLWDEETVEMAMKGELPLPTSLKAPLNAVTTVVRSNSSNAISSASAVSTSSSSSSNSR